MLIVFAYTHSDCKKNTPCRAHRLSIGLKHYRACNAVLIKLVDQENRRDELEQRGHQIEGKPERPNITVSHIAFNGSRVKLPGGVALRC